MGGRKLYQQLQGLLETDRILWGVICGDTTIQDISLRWLIPPSKVVREVENHPLIKSTKSGGVWIPKDAHYELKEFVRVFKAQVINRGVIGTLTDKQRKTLEFARGMGRPFRALDLARAQGYNNPGFTYSQIRALEKKGCLRKIGEDPLTWEVI